MPTLSEGSLLRVSEFPTKKVRFRLVKGHQQKNTGIDPVLFFAACFRRARPLGLENVRVFLGRSESPRMGYFNIFMKKFIIEY